MTKFYEMKIVLSVKVEANDAREARAEASKIAGHVMSEATGYHGLPVGATWANSPNTAAVNVI